MDIKKLLEKAVEQFKAKNYDAALKTIAKVKRVNPNVREVLHLEADIYTRQQNFVKAHGILERVIKLIDLSKQEKLTPKQRDMNSLVFAKMAIDCGDLGLFDRCIGYHRQAIELAESFPIKSNVISDALMTLCYFEDIPADEYQFFFDEYKKLLADIKPYPRKVYEHGKIRVGFISGDFRNHAVLRFSWHLWTKLNPNIFTIYLYSNVKDPDHITDQLRQKNNIWRDITKLTDEEAAKLIREDEIDILFDMSGHTMANRLAILAYRPALVQMSGIGYNNSIGLGFDYFLSDVHCTENAAAVSEYFDEKVIRMPHSHVCFAPPTDLREPALEPPCLKNGFVTFGSFNNFRKVTDNVLTAWKRVLDAVPNSRLLLKAKIFFTEDGKKFVGERMKKFGFDLDRIEMRGWTNTHPLDYNDMDIALDTYPYTGCTTTCEALWMGVPVVTLYGDVLESRIGYSILKNIGLDELAVTSWDEYVNRAVALANDWELIAVLKKNLRTMMKKSPLMDWRIYIRDIEQVFIAIFEHEREEFFATHPEEIPTAPTDKSVGEIPADEKISDND